MEIHIKPVENQSELNQALSIRHEVFVEEQKVPASVEIDEWEKTATHFLAWSGGKPVGAARLRWLSHGVGKVERVAILLSLRGAGIGRALMEAVETHAANQGGRIIKLHAQSQAVPFYQKLGYAVQGNPFMDAGIEHFEMKKSILI